MRRLLVCSVLVLFSGFTLSFSQPGLAPEGVLFTFSGDVKKTVALVGDFNGWSKDADFLIKGGSGKWAIVKKLEPGIYQYKFVIDADKYALDPANPETIDNYNSSGKNSVFVLTPGNEIVFTSEVPRPKSNRNDTYPKLSGTKPVYLNIIWHQHQPLYLNPETDQLQGPWVRTHATKDYYDMAAMLSAYPNVHCNINLTSSLLHQLREYYVNRLRPFVDVQKNSVDVQKFWKKWKGKTDPWIDLALKPTKDFDSTDRKFLYENIWNAFGMSEVMIDRFPEYKSLKMKLDVDQLPGGVLFTEQEMREIKFWFYFAYFDPDFLRGPVRLPDGTVCDLSSYVEERDGKFYLTKTITEADCNRMVAEAYKVSANIIPIHKKLSYDSNTGVGQVEVITTPFYHPILPLIVDSDIARISQPNDRLPPRFAYPQDANAQVAKAVKMYKEIFGTAPSGMWPGEGSVAQPILNILRDNGFLWTASDEKVLARSDPPGSANTMAYRFAAGKDKSSGTERGMALVFRDTELSDRIGFKYQNYSGEEAAEDFILSILNRTPKADSEDVLVTVILDGENAWEWYKHDNDAKEFLNAFYRKLSKLFDTRQVITTTTTEFIQGNSKRGINAHPIEKLPRMKWLWPGSWINANYDTWIGEEEENIGWTYLLQARQDLEKSGIKMPDPLANPPKEKSREWYGYLAWEAMYAAEGSDWFWWFGSDQSAPAGDEPFDEAFRLHLKNVYKFMKLAGVDVAIPTFEPIIGADRNMRGSQGVMAQSRDGRQRVRFVCDASKEKVPDAIYIVGNVQELSTWTPNTIAMYDDGTNGDDVKGDGIWSIIIELPIGSEIQYKFTNSGKKGEWIPGEEFPTRNRTFKVLQPADSGIVTLENIFGK